MKTFHYLILEQLFVVVLFLSHNMPTNAQSIISDSTSSTAWYFESGGIYYHFRDEIASNLSYAGLGGGRLGMGYHLLNNKNTHHDIRLNFEYGAVKYKKNPKDDTAEIYRLTGTYSIYWKKIALENKWGWSFGGTATSEALYIVYPYLFGNNGDAYSIDMLALGPNFGVTSLFKKSKIELLWNIDLLEWNIRPQSYNGIGAEKTFSENKWTGFTNNVRINFKAGYSIEMARGNSLEISYHWNYRKNTSTKNILNYAQHNLNLRYYLANKNKR